MSFFGLTDNADTRATAGAINKVADPNTMNDFHTVVQSGSGEHSTENIGRIWSDKTVSTSGITLEGTDEVTDQTISMGINGDENNPSDFLVALSALSSASNTTSMISTPLDIILVLDASGSMDDNLTTYTYTEEYPQEADNDDEFFALVDGEYVEIRTESRGQWPNRYYVWLLNDEEVTAKTSENDSNPDHIQFYSRRATSSVSKMKALKTAANSFIDATAAQNDKITDVSKQHHIAVVKYSGDVADDYGNETYRSGGNTWNYSQCLNQLQAYTTSNVQSLRNGVNSINPAGGTAADNGMSVAQSEMDKNGREGAKKVIIFFTDGQPNHGSGFSTAVATTAIQTAGAFKQAGGLVFSIGVVNGADPSDTSNTGDDNINAYLHSVSSNYPNATGWSGNRWNMGTRAENSEYYYAASNADELNEIFSKIQESVSSDLQSPTEIESGANFNTGGYLTFTDELGDYMKVDDFKSIIYGGKRYDNPAVSTSVDKTTTTYTFEGEAQDNGIYKGGNIHDIIITVTHGASEKAGDTVTVKVPASLIPLRKFNVDTDKMTMTVTEAWPIRIFYGVSLKSGVAEKITNPTAELDDALKNYIASNLDTDGNVQFYSNKTRVDENGKPLETWAQGTTTTLFDPASSNNFYFNSNEIKLYMDKELTVPAKLTDLEEIKKATFYFSEPYYVEDKTATDDDATDNVYPCVLKTGDVTSFSGAQMAVDQSDWGYDKNGEMYIKAGGPRISTLTDLKDNKTSNSTETATTVIDPTWVSREDPSAGVQVYLGNNGRLELDVPGTLAVEKNIEAAGGFTLGDTQKDASFTFNIALTAPAGEKLAGTYKAVVRDTDGNNGELFDITVTATGDATGNATHSIKADETLFIYGLPAGTSYKVTEDENSMPGGFTEKSKVDHEGTIAANDTKTEAFTNIYEADSITWPEEDLTVSKTLDERPTQAGDVFNFTVVGTATGSAGLTAPMPSNAADGTFQITMDAGVDAPAVKNYVLGKIEFTKPGTYTYTIDEAQGNLAGVNYELGYYTLTVTVADDGKGALSIASSDCKYTVNTTSTAHDVSNAMNFTNTYKVGEVTEPLRGGKILLGRDLERNEFQFQLTEITDTDPNDVTTRYTANNTVDDYKSILPTGVDEIGGIVTNGAVAASDLRVISFGNITFTGESIGHTYTYTIQEIKDNPGIPGVTYDGDLTRVVTVTVESETTANGEALIVKILSDDKTEGSAYASNFTFTNTYQATPLTLTGDAFVKGEKTFDGRDASEDLMFSLVPVSDDAKELMGAGVERKTIVEASELKKDTTVSFNFGEMTFNKAGTYSFAVMEDLAGIDDTSYMKWDRHVAEVTIKVKEELDANGNHTGRLVLDGDVIYVNNTTNAPSEVASRTDAAVFLNVYTASADYPDIHVVKQLTGRDTKALGAGEFNFTITGVNGEGTTADQANAKLAEGDKTFLNSAPTTGTTTVSMQKLPALTFNQDDAGKTYVYLVDEVEPTDATTNADGTITKDGVTYDQSKYLVTIAVNDDGDGTMSTPTTVQKLNKDGNAVGDPVKYASTADISTHATMTFTNEYKPASVDVTDVSFNKIVEGRDWLDGETFEFTMSAETQGSPQPTNPVVTLTNPADNGYTENQTVPVQGFGTLTFDQPGVYVYRVAETHASETINGLTYDSTPAKATITVTDNGAGQLVASVSYADRNFNNVYSSDASFDEAFNFAVTKQLNGHAMTSEQFEFNMEAVNGPVATDATAAETAAKLGLPDGLTTRTFDGPTDATADGVVATVLSGLGENMKFTQADSGKTFSVAFSETDEGADGYTYDKATYRLDITPSDNEATGAMTLKVKVTKSVPNQTNEVTEYTWTEGAEKVPVTLPFVNKYEASGSLNGATNLAGTKTVTSTNDEYGDDLSGFVFQIAQSKDNPAQVTLPTNATSGADGNFAFGDIKFTKPGIYTFTVSEVAGDNPAMFYDSSIKNITVNVKEDNATVGNGKLVAEVLSAGSDELTFTNTYSSTTYGAVGGLDVTKTLTGRTLVANQFSFTIEGLAAEDDSTNAEQAEAKLADADKSFKNAAPKDGVATMAKLEDVKFDKSDIGKTYTYLISEIKDGKLGYTYDEQAVTVAITVLEKDDAIYTSTVVTKNGQSSNAVEGSRAVAEFANSYNAEGTATPVVTKVLNGRNMAANEFKFTLSNITKTDAPVAIAEGTNAEASDGAAGSVSFTGENADYGFKDGTFSFNVAMLDALADDGYANKGAVDGKTTWTLKLKVNESINPLPGGVTAATSEVAFNIVVTDEGNGALTSAISESEIKLVNTYGSADMTVSTDSLFTKAIDGRDWLATDEFSFTLKALNGAPLRTDGAVDGAKTVTVTSDTAKENEKVAFSFGTFTYKFEDIRDAEIKDGVRTKTFMYEVTENDFDATKMPGVTKDSRKATLKITVTDNGTGQMTATPELLAMTRVENGDFVNTYSSNLDFEGLLGGFDITKHLEGREVEMGQFTFTVTPKDGDNTSAKDAAELLGVNAAGTEYKSIGGGHDVRIPGPLAKRELTQDDAGKTFVYEVSENADKDKNPSYDFDDTLYTVKITVNDNNNGSLTATTVVYDGATEVAKLVLTTTDQGESVAPRVAVPFENTYTAKNSATAAIAARKELTNASLVDHHFTFRVTDALNNGVAVATSDDNGKIDFGTFTYTLADLNNDAASGKATLGKEGVNYVYSYQYKVAEDAPASGITAETNFFTVTVKVIDDNHGNLRTEVVYPGSTPDKPVTELVFKNVYGENAEYNLDITGTKVYNKPSGLEYNAPDIANMFEFEITGVDEDGQAAPLPSTTKVKNDASGNVSFGSIHYDMNVFGSAPQVGQKRVKTFTYTVTETGKVEGVENDATVKTFTVTVTDEGDGKNITAVADPVTGPKFSFTNEYKVTPKDSSLTGEGNFTITKELDGRALAAEEFEFALYAADGSKVETAKNDANGNVEFPAMTFNTPGSYEYTLKEIELTNVDNGITYDTSSYKVVAGVTDNGKGALEVKWSVFDGIEDVTSDTTIIFTNTYEATATSATFGAAKLLDGADLAKDQFTFELINKDGKVIATAKNDADGNIQFPSVELKYEGAYKFSVAEKNDGQEGVTYDDTVYGIDVVVTDDGKGHLVAEVKYEGDTAPVFKNTYTKPVDPTPEPKPEEPAKPTLPTTGDTAWAQTAIAALAAGTGLIAWGVKKRKRS